MNLDAFWGVIFKLKDFANPRIISGFTTFENSETTYELAIYLKNREKSGIGLA